MTGQGPYYGQAAWFKMYHHEKLPSAVERYVEEINRVTSVLEGQLVQEKKQYGESGDGPWLVGNKFSYLEAVFVPYQRVAALLLKDDGFNEDKYPHVKEWIDKILSRGKVSYILDNFGKSE
jgi:glutathione S-transferase